MTRVAVAPGKFAKGVVSVADGAMLDKKAKPVRYPYELVELDAALERTWTTDAHLVTYVVRDPSGAPLLKQMRITKDALASVEALGYSVEVESFFCDVDNPEHAEWTPELRTTALEQHATLPTLATAGVYATQHGRRILQPLASPIPAREAELYLERWLGDLEKAGIAVDWSCRDWTRHFRLPNVNRGGAHYRSPWLDVARSRPLVLDPIVVVPGIEPARKPRVVAPVVTVDWHNEVSGDLLARVEPIARAAASRPKGTGHALYLALSGALLSRGVPAAELPAFVRAVALVAGEQETGDREMAAKTTAERKLSGRSVRGLRQLHEEWPAVANAVDDVFVRKLAAERLGPTLEAEAATAELLDVIRKAPDGLTIVGAACGLGKTHAAELVAVERALVEPDAERAPARTKTSISVDKHRLAAQIAEHLRAAGVGVRRVFGPLSVKNELGQPECKYHDIAKHLVHGRQSMQWELCEGRGKEPCAFRETCRAADGVEGPKEARITIGPHQLIGELDAAAGATGLLVIDEPPSLLETEVLTAENFDFALQMLHAFSRRFASAIRPAHQALRAYLGEAETDEVCSAVEAVRHGAEYVDAGALDAAIAATELASFDDAVVECVKLAHYPDHRGTAPPLERVRVAMAKSDASYAAQLGAASRVLATVYQALTSETHVSIRVEEVKDKRAMFVTKARSDLVRALRRDGSVVVTDANAEIHAPIFARVVGYEPHRISLSAPDGAPVQRTHIRTYGATRRHWISHGRLVLEGLVNQLRAAVDWVREEHSMPVVGIITVRLLSLAIEATLRPDAATLAEEWARSGQTKLETVRATLGPILSRLPSPPVLGHYGALRGLNSMAHVDQLVTLGDPWTDLAMVRNDADFLGLGDAWPARYEALARAELEQAHGRLRAIHRAKPARALHVGALTPSGNAWTQNVETRSMPNGRPETTRTMRPDEVARLAAALGGIGETAKRLGCHRVTLSKYVHGSRAVPPAVSGELRRLAIAVSATFPTNLVGEHVAETPRIDTRLGVSATLAIGLSTTSDDDDDPSGGGAPVTASSESGAEVVPFTRGATAPVAYLEAA